ncbi:ATP synthase delta chain mitochondrial precursor [Lipomyces oligophaga]|uniref:ATP synthase delta chain mitochondrial precursor n=1 Tax=Lipomyces oligophaga TaxID=45792 RepID=UPI0034CEB0B9
MAVLRQITRAAVRPRQIATSLKGAVRGYADVPSDKIRLSFTVPHQSLYKDIDVVQVNIPATTGDLGVLANHVPTIEQLKPGVIDIVEESGTTKQFFVSGGFATVQPGSFLSINAVEAYPVEDFSPEAIRAQLAEAQKNSTAGSEIDQVEAQIELEVLEALAAVAK